MFECREHETNGIELVILPWIRGCPSGSSPVQAILNQVSLFSAKIAAFVVHVSI